jgi:hypothetical protein
MEWSAGIVFFKPEGNRLNCTNIDISMTPAERAKKLGQVIFAEALIYKKTFGYVYWIGNSDGPHEVFHSAIHIERMRARRYTVERVGI